MILRRKDKSLCGGFLCKNMRLILASNSPRRREYMKKITTDYQVIPSTVEEVVPPDASPEEVALSLARQKAQDVYLRHGGVVLGADTIVAFENQILGKPKDEGDARRMLTMLSGKTHRVVTGVALYYDGGNVGDAVCTAVTFGKMSKEQIDKYVLTGSPMDKAGAYGIQDGYIPIEGLSGSYDNVIGFPTERIRELLQEVLDK